MALTAEQRSDLHVDIYDYLRSRGPSFAACAAAFLATIDSDHHSRRSDAPVTPSLTSLEEKWSSSWPRRSEERDDRRENDELSSSIVDEDAGRGGWTTGDHRRADHHNHAGASALNGNVITPSTVTSAPSVYDLETDDEGDNQVRTSGHPLPTGGKRKSTHHLESREGMHAPTKRNDRCGAIAVDDSIDQSTGENGQDDDNVGMTLAASGRRLNTDDISKNTTPPTNFGMKRYPRGNVSIIKNTSKTNNNRRINDIHSHLRGTKRGDDIESIHSMGDLQIRETKSTTHTSDRGISKKDDYGQSRTKKTYGLANQIKRTGMRMIDNFGEEEEWIDTSTKPSKFAMACGEDPLDLARSLHEADRRPASSSTFHDIARKTPQKVKHYVSQTMSDVLDNILLLAASGCRRRKYTADAALERRTANETPGRPFPTGKKRKPTHQLQSNRNSRAIRRE